MKIVFGWRRLTLKKISLEELNIEADNIPQDSKVVISQAYFHLFWIPFFSLGRRYTLEIRGVGYELPVNLHRKVVQSGINVKGKWYAWTLLILLGVALVGFTIMAKVEQNNQQNELEQYRKNSAKQKKIDENLIENPQVGTQIWVQGSNPYTVVYDIHFDARYKFEIEKVTADSVLILIDRMEEMDNRMRFESKKGISAIGIDSLEALIGYRESSWTESKYVDSVAKVYPRQKMMQKMIILGLEDHFNKYDLVNIPIAQFKALKKTLGRDNSVPIDAFAEINAGWVKIEQIEPFSAND